MFWALTCQRFNCVVSYIETHHSSRLGNAKTIAQDLKVALERYNTLNSELEVSSQLRDKLELTMHMRVNLVKRWRESVSTRITGQFHTLMSQRGVKGSMKVDHRKGELILMVSTVVLEYIGTCNPV